MTKLVASTFIGSGSLWLFLDDKIIMQDSDAIIVELDDNEEYMIYWFAKGTPGSSYSLTLSSPRDAQFQLTRVVGATGKDNGSFRFKV